MKFKCQFHNCYYETVNYKWIILHTWNFHSMQRNFAVICNISGCTTKFTNQKIFTRHIRVKHSGFHEKFLKTYVKTDDAAAMKTSGNSSNSVVEDIIVDTGTSSNEEDDEADDNENQEQICSSDVVDDIADILIELRELHGVTQSAISAICDKFVNILQIDRFSQKQKIERSLKNNHTNFVIDYETNLILDSDSPFKRPLQRFANGPALNNYIAQKKEYVPPCEITLGYDAVKKSKDCIYYVPILKTMENYLSCDDVLGDVLHLDDNNRNGDLINFKDGANYKNNELYAVHPNALQIVLYHDDFTQSNPLGNKTNKFKISGFYYLIGKLKFMGHKKHRTMH